MLFAYHLFCRTIIRQSSHPNDHFGATRQKRLRLIRSSSGNIQKVLARCPVHLDVSVSDVMLVSFQCHVSMFLRGKSDHCLTVPATLDGQTESYASSGRCNETKKRFNIKMI